MHITFPSHQKIWLFGLLNITLAGSIVATAHADTIDGFGKLKFGMQPSEVESLEGCSDNTQCLYEILGKNRYFTLIYGANKTSTTTTSPSPTTTLSYIHIDMGMHTNEWFAELYAALAAQHPLTYLPTNEEKRQFNEGAKNELIVGFANGSILLQLLRRPFGNVVLRVIIQNQEASTALRQIWESTGTQSAAQ